MRKAMLLLAVFGLVGTIWAADPSVGTWKLNIAKSKMPPSAQAPVKEETQVTREVGDQYEITFTGTRTDGSTFSLKFSCPQKGGVVKYENAPEGQMSVTTMISPSEWYGTSLSGGKQVAFGHYVISKDGKTMTRTGKGTDDKGKPYESLAVWEKQ